MPTGQLLARPFGRLQQAEAIGKNVELMMRGSTSMVALGSRYNDIQPHSSQLRRLPLFIKQHTLHYCNPPTLHPLLLKSGILRPTHSQPHQHKTTTISQHCLTTMAPHAENVTGVASDGKEVPVNPGEAPLEPGIKKNIAQGKMIAFPS